MQYHVPPNHAFISIMHAASVSNLLDGADGLFLGMSHLAIDKCPRCSLPVAAWQFREVRVNE